ncbi:hypothetical protein [Aquabacterium sp.]|uniref:hypothetical protein n=1 Tax=Aquabacterium sp. TaxID=1872578 RepID=UPI0037847807
MATPSTLNAVIARVATGLYDIQLGYATMDWAVKAVTSNPAYAGNLSALVQSLYGTDIQTHSQAATLLVQNLVEKQVTSLDATLKANLITYVQGLLDTAGAGHEGETIVSLVNGFSTLTTHPEPTIMAAVAAFNSQISAALSYSAAEGTPDVPVHPPVTQTTFFTITAEKTAPGTGDGQAVADVMHLTGNQDVRIDFTNPAHQITGLDLNGDGTIRADGQENNSAYLEANVDMVANNHSGFEIVDAYSRNPLNNLDTANNFLGDITFDGRSTKADGVTTNGNIVLGGLGADTIYGGVGNDFLTGGAVAQGHAGSDYLSGGRNADFFFAEFSALDNTDGVRLQIDGGNTADNNSAGNSQSSQDSDWLLLEAGDDDEPVQIWLNDDNVGPAEPGDGISDNKGRVLSRSGTSMVIDDLENIDASGNLYGFLDNMDVKIGERAVDDRGASNADAGGNYGYGSAAQLDIKGSDAGNIIIAGYDNDVVHGNGGNDLLMGGRLDHLQDPNLVGIVNDGRDELYGDAGNDNIVFEADGGVIDGGADTDTLWITNLSLGTKTATDLTTDGVLRFDLKSQTLANAAGYGGANVDGTQDQTNYKGSTRVTTTNMESVIATGLGAVDYAAAGSNNPELLFSNQQNLGRYNGSLDLRGTDGANTLFASGGNDVIEGRGGNDLLSGGDGNDDFYFGTADGGNASTYGDGVDVIERQTDANGDNLWDGFDATKGSGGLYERDFNIGGTSTTGSSVLKIAIQKAGGNTAGTQLNQVVNNVSEIVTGVKDGSAFVPIDLNTTAIKAATTYQGLTDAINAALDATAYGADLQATLQADGFTIFITDAKGRELADSSTEVAGAGVSVNQIANTATQNTFEFGAPSVAVTKDRLIYKAYEDRADNEGVDDDSYLGSTISLGLDAYAEDLVINFADEDNDGLATTRLAEDQAYTLKFTNLTTQDKVTIEVNGVKYTLQVGVDLDGNIIEAEDGVNGDTQAGIQSAFITRLNAFINSFMDDDTSAGKVSSTTNGTDTLTLTQAAYNGEQTVFMVKPTVTLQNLSGGEPSSVAVTNVSQHEVELLDFDGRNGELNSTNVLFWGQESVNRATLQTAKTAGDTIVGSEAIVIDVGANDLQDVVYGTTTAIPNNTATNFPLSTVVPGWSVHGDDFLLGGDGLDTISGGTGDDRIEGSIGGNGTTTWDVLDGGKNFYAVQVLGEPQARVYVLNKWEAANPSKVAALQGLQLTSVTLINQNESGTGTSSGVFDDTLQFSQKLFTPGVTRFTITLDNFTLNGGVVELRNDGAGTVGVDVDGNGTIDNWTKFTNFENVRTVSGVGNAVAGDGQGNDTLNVAAMSSATTGANGILYNLTNNALGGAGGDPGSVMYSANAHADLTRPAATDFESLVIKVDGVESVIGGTGDDLLLIDETEAAKNNTFTGDLGDDRIEYQNAFSGEATPGAAEPTVTIKVDNVPASLGGTDTVTMTGGRVGTTVAVDTLNGVEFITLEGRTAASTREDDVLDVTSMTTGAVVSYVDGTVKDTGGVLHLTVEGIEEIENIWADGNDTVIVADADKMSTNQREDTANGTASKDLSLATFLDFDQLNSSNQRVPFISQTTGQIEDAVNQGEFKFNLSKTGAGNDTDTVDYSNASDNIAVVVELDATKPNQYVLVDGDGPTFYSGGVGDLTSATDRVDVLTGVERVVASLGESVLDLTSSTKGLEIKWSAFDVANQNAALDRDVYTVRISDLATASPLQRSFVEYRDAGLSNTVTQGQATWNRVEGSDNAEVIIMNSAHSMDADTFNLRGGANQVKYNELTKSITLTLAVTDWSAAAPTTSGKITGDVQFQDGTGAGVEGPYIPGSQHHTITSYTANNGIASGSLKIAASQDAEDTIKFAAGLGDKIFVLSEAGTVDNQITVKLGSGSAQNSVILTGFELLSDADTNDVYDFGSLVNAAAGLDIIDSGANDHDTVKVGNDAIGFDGSNALGGGAVNAGATEISLGAIRDFAWKATPVVAGFDFDVLDVTKVTDTSLTTLTGALASGEFNTDEVVIGKVNNINSALGFESVVFTQATVTENGTTFILDTSANSVKAGAKAIALTDGTNTLSFGGTVLEDARALGSLRAATDLNVTSGVTVTVVGNEAVNITGGNGNDSITSKGGNDVLRGGSGNDTLDGGFTAAVAPVISYSFNGGAAVLAADGDRITILGVTVEADTTPATPTLNVAGAIPVVVGADSDTVGAAFAGVSLANWKTAITGAGTGLTAGEIADLQSVSYDAAANRLIFTFTGADSGVAQGDFTAATTGGAPTITVTLGNAADVAYAAATQSSDTYVFEATAALNGADTINNFNAANLATDDLLDFRAFLGVVASTPNLTAANFVTTGLDLTANNVGVAFNKGSLASTDIATAAAAGKIAVADNHKAVVLVTGDVDGVSDATIDAYKVYYVEDTDATATQSWTVTLVGTINSGTELNAADLLAGTTSFV